MRLGVCLGMWQVMYVLSVSDVLECTSFGVLRWAYYYVCCAPVRGLCLCMYV